MAGVQLAADREKVYFNNTEGEKVRKGCRIRIFYLMTWDIHVSTCRCCSIIAWYCCYYTAEIIAVSWVSFFCVYVFRVDHAMSVNGIAA